MHVKLTRREPFYYEDRERNEEVNWSQRWPVRKLCVWKRSKSIEWDKITCEMRQWRINDGAAMKVSDATVGFVRVSFLVQEQQIRKLIFLFPSFKVPLIPISQTLLNMHDLQFFSVLLWPISFNQCHRIQSFITSLSLPFHQPSFKFSTSLTLP